MIRQIWDEWKQLVMLLQSPNPSLRGIINGEIRKNATAVQKLCTDFVTHWKFQFGTTSRTAMPFYFHVIESHVLQFLIELGSLQVFSLQNLERTHLLNYFIWLRATNNGGGKKKHLFVLERMLENELL